MSSLRSLECNRFRLILPRVAGWLTLLVAVAFVFSAVAQAKDPTTVPVLKRIEEKSLQVARLVLPATVGIINLSQANTGRMGEGSGVVISEDGLITAIVVATVTLNLVLVLPGIMGAGDPQPPTRHGDSACRFPLQSGETRVPAPEGLRENSPAIYRWGRG
ncbi:MAG: hypothetical protein WCJ35_24915 [Planctomycetota bacterium]